MRKMEKEGGRGGGGRKSGGRRSHVFLDEVDQPGLFERACGPTMPTSGATATHFTSSIIPSTFPCGRGAGRRGGEGKTKMRESVVVEQLRAGSGTRFREWNRV